MRLPYNGWAGLDLVESGEDVQTNNNNHYEIPNKNLFSIIKQ